MMIIQEELVSLAAERRLIPFLGAGFSASLGLPSWEKMLRDVCAATEEALPFDDIISATNGDLLQVAEYLYLQHDKQIGPIRHQIERSFSTQRPDPLASGPHVELVNLGAGQIYTTNYDDIIEQTYRKLGLPVTPVILPKDVALADPDRTQVVKYHGDLTHERTLVLTESAYYKRLDFESPMDLKFRSDLLGKSVLFMGYSFRDVNIRIIWFKLMEMMRDIPEADRRPSYIVRFEPNAVLEQLYAAVGLKTIVLNPHGPIADSATRVRLMGEFLLSLSTRADTVARKRGGGMSDAYVSQALIDAAIVRLERVRGYHPGTSSMLRYRGIFGSEDAVFKRLFSASVPKPLEKAWEEVVVKLLPFVEVSDDTLSVIDRLSDADAVARLVVGILHQNGSSEARADKQKLLASPVPWQEVWAAHVSSSEAVEILALLEQEIQYQATGGADEDIAYLADLANRIAKGQLLDPDSDSKDGIPPQILVERAEELLRVAAQIYPAISELQISDGAPEVEAVLRQVRKREKQFVPAQIDMEQLYSHGVYVPGRSRARSPLRSSDAVRKSRS